MHYDVWFNVHKNKSTHPSSVLCMFPADYHFLSLLYCCYLWESMTGQFKVISISFILNTLTLFKDCFHLQIDVVSEIDTSNCASLLRRSQTSSTWLAIILLKRLTLMIMTHPVSFDQSQDLAHEDVLIGFAYSMRSSLQKASESVACWLCSWDDMVHESDAMLLKMRLSAWLSFSAPFMSSLLLQLPLLLLPQKLWIWECNWIFSSSISELEYAPHGDEQQPKLQGSCCFGDLLCDFFIRSQGARFCGIFVCLVFYAFTALFDRCINKFIFATTVTRIAKTLFCFRIFRHHCLLLSPIPSSMSPHHQHQARHHSRWRDDEAISSIARSFFICSCLSFLFIFQRLNIFVSFFPSFW